MGKHAGALQTAKLETANYAEYAEAKGNGPPTSGDPTSTEQNTRARCPCHEGDADATESPVLTGRRVGGLQSDLEPDPGGINVLRRDRSAEERKNSFGHRRPQPEVSPRPDRVAD